jgi:predicted PurR-regulated permease PerM
MMANTDDAVSTNEKPSRGEFVRRILTIVAVVIAAGLIVALFWYGIDVILLVFTGLLLAVFFRGLSDWVSRRTRLSSNWSLSLVLLAILGVSALGVWLLIPSLRQQFAELTESLPQALEKLRASIGQYSWGQWILGQVPQNPQQITQTSNLFGRITGFFSNFLGVVANLFIILATGIYFAFDPKLYKVGVIKLFPGNRQKRAEEVLDTLGITLHNWLLGRIAVMTINGALTALGLWFLGIPMAIPLGIITGLLNFIPNIGPFLAAAPAVLLAFTESPTAALYVVVLFFIIQNLDGFVLTPLVEQETVSLPPVLVLASQLLLGILFGFMGVLLAVPIVAVVFVMVKMLYVEDVLGNQVEVKGEKEATG